MRIDVDKHDFDCIIDALKQSMVKSQMKRAQDLARRLEWQLYPSKAPDKNGFAPMRRNVSIRSSWPSGFVKPEKKRNSFYNKDNKEKKVKLDKPKATPLTADEILASL